MSELGFYSFNITEELQGKIIASQLGGFAYQYSPEYKFQEQSNSLLALVEDTEGKIINSVEDIYEIKSNKGHTKRNITNLLLITAMLLFLFDITYRRLGLKRYINKKLFYNIKEKIYASKIEQYKEENNTIKAEKIGSLIKKNKEEKNIFKKEIIKTDLEEKKLDIKQEKTNIKRISICKGRFNRDKSKNQNGGLNTGELLKKKRERNED